MPINTSKTFLMKKDAETYKKLVDIRNFPDIGAKPSKLETTTLSDVQETSIPGIVKLSDMQFEINYDTTVYDELEALKDQKLDLAIWFGGTVDGDTVTPTGDNGKFEFKGYVNVWVSGGNVDEVVKMYISVMPSSKIKKASA